MPKKEYVERNITLVGRTKANDEDDKACEVCTEANNFFTTAAKHDNRLKYEKIEIDTPQGQDIAEKEDIRDIPYIKDCRTFEKGKPARCREIEGFSAEDDFSDLEDLIENQAVEAEKSAPKEETAAPSEPKEPQVEEPKANE